MRRRIVTPAVALCVVAGAVVLAFHIGSDFFPSVDAGQIKLHLRAATGVRIERTAALCDRIEATIRSVIPAREVETVVDNIGVPYSGINTAYSTSAPVGPGDADIYISLTSDHRPTERYVRALREKLTAVYPDVTFSFLPADIVSQILNFGLPSPVDVQVAGFDTSASRTYVAARCGNNALGSPCQKGVVPRAPCGSSSTNARRYTRCSSAIDPSGSS